MNNVGDGNRKSAPCDQSFFLKTNNFLFKRKYHRIFVFKKGKINRKNERKTLENSSFYLVLGKYFGCAEDISRLTI